MAITLIGQPNIITPAYNPVVWYFDSTNKNQPGFRYVVDLYKAGTATKIAEFRVAPRPTDGYGYVDLSKILSDMVDKDFKPTNITSFDAINSYYNYDLKIGEEYIQNWSFTDTIFETGNKTKFTQSPNTTPHTFIVGDQIVIDQTLDLIPSAEGLQTITAVPDAYNIVVNVAFISTGLNPGTIKYADNRKVVIRNLYTALNKSVFNAAESFVQFKNYLYTNFSLLQSNNTTKQALTNQPVIFYATVNQDIWFNYMKDPVDVVSQRIRFINSNGDNLTKAFMPGTLNQTVLQTSVGPGNAEPILITTGTLPLIKSDTLWYDFYTYTAVNAQTSKTYRVYLDRRCAINDYEIVFMDRRGSMSSYAFQLKSKVTGNITRQNYNQQLGFLNVNKYDYNLEDAGQTNYNIDVTKQYELNTNWMDDASSIYFEELLTSPYTWIKLEDGNYYSCIIQDSSFETHRQANKNLIKKTITLQLSNKENINI
jgi:hypothetical protein